MAQLTEQEAWQALEDLIVAGAIPDIRDPNDMYKWHLPPPGLCYVVSRMARDGVIDRLTHLQMNKQLDAAVGPRRPPHAGYLTMPYEWENGVRLALVAQLASGSGSVV